MVHGTEVHVADVAQYLRKANAFKQNLNGITPYPVDGRGIEICEKWKVYRFSSRRINYFFWSKIRRWL
jgi:hypothetical protein